MGHLPQALSQIRPWVAVTGAGSSSASQPMPQLWKTQLHRLVQAGSSWLPVGEHLKVWLQEEAGYLTWSGAIAVAAGARVPQLLP